MSYTHDDHVPARLIGGVVYRRSTDGEQRRRHARTSDVARLSIAPCPNVLTFTPVVAVICVVTNRLLRFCLRMTCMLRTYLYWQPPTFNYTGGVHLDSVIRTELYLAQRTFGYRSTLNISTRRKDTEFIAHLRPYSRIAK